MSALIKNLSNRLSKLLLHFVFFLALQSSAWAVLSRCDRTLHVVRSDSKYLATDPNEPDLAAEGVIDEDGDLRIGLYTKREDGTRPQTSMRGADQFAEIVNHFGSQVKRIEADFDPSSDLMTEFNQLIGRGFSPKKAAKMTWIGKQCAKFGYTEVTIADLQNTRHGYVFADFYFSKPN